MLESSFSSRLWFRGCFAVKKEPPISNSLSVLIFLMLVGTFMLVACIFANVKHPALDVPPARQNKDGVFYDNIAFCLAAGDGFSIDFQDPLWRSRYEAFNQQTLHKGFYDWVLKFQGQGPTTMRAPGYPVFLLGIYQAFGWNWAWARLVGCLAMAVGLASLLTFVWRKVGFLPASIAWISILLDYSIMESGGTIASESLAIGVLALVCVTLINAWEKPSNLRWAIAGLFFAILMLVRSNWNLGLLLLIVASLLMLIPRVRIALLPVTPRHLLFFFSACIVVAAPWWIRNCWLTHQAQPFGTAGANGLVGAYCDSSWENYGNWQNRPMIENQKEVRKNLPVTTLTLAEQEALTGQASIQKAKTWVGTNLEKIPPLMLFRFISHWGLTNASVPLPFRILNVGFILIALTSAVLIRSRWLTILIILLAIDAMMVMLTWAHVGRYGIPMRPLLHIYFGMALAAMIMQIINRRPPIDLEADHS